MSPCPPLDRRGGTTGWLETWRALQRDGTYDTLSTAALGRWEREHLRPLADLELHWDELIVGDTLLHFDPRFDNILIDDHGTARLVDWSRACTGPAWVDLVCLLMQSDLGARDPQKIFLAGPAGRDADPLQVDAFLVALGSYWTHTATLPGPDHAPHLRERREHSRRATMSRLRSRWTQNGAPPTTGTLR
ncbi:phosphotransferase family protein [Nonomuraea spiralis]|uniref:phosphotransferase family protein n=2 Tax=Nonomuraea TaxID=83681 RepID=UPI00379E8EFC